MSKRTEMIIATSTVAAALIMITIVCALAINGEFTALYTSITNH